MSNELDLEGARRRFMALLVPSEPEESPESEEAPDEEEPKTDPMIRILPPPYDGAGLCSWCYRRYVVDPKDPEHPICYHCATSYMGFEVR